MEFFASVKSAAKELFTSKQCKLVLEFLATDQPTVQAQS